MNKSYTRGQFNFKRGNLWGNYCPVNGSYYLCHAVYGVIASYNGDDWADMYPAQQYPGFYYDAVREICHLGRLTRQTKEFFEFFGGDSEFLKAVLA